MIKYSNNVYLQSSNVSQVDKIGRIIIDLETAAYMRIYMYNLTIKLKNTNFTVNFNPWIASLHNSHLARLKMYESIMFLDLVELCPKYPSVFSDIGDDFLIPNDVIEYMLD